MYKRQNLHLAQAAVASLSTGERIAFLEIFSGLGMLTLGTRAHGVKVIDGWDRNSPLGNKTWDFSDPVDQDEAHRLIDYLDPVIVHSASPCDKLSCMGLHPSQKSFDREAYDKSVSMAEFSVEVIKRREAVGGGGSLENPWRSRLWKLERVLAFLEQLENRNQAGILPRRSCVPMKCETLLKLKPSIGRR